MPEGAPPDSTDDCLFGGHLRLRQPARGHRAGTDAVLLAAAVPPIGNGLIIDIGAGVGTVGLAIALRNPQASLCLLDDNPKILDFARHNLDANGLSERGRAAEADIFVPKSRRSAGVLDDSAGLVVTNPPFFSAAQGRPSPDRDRAHAHTMGDRTTIVQASLTAWIRASLALVAPGGRFAMIHRPESLADILSAMANRLGAIRIIPIYPHADASATRILVGGLKGSRAPLSVRPGLILHASEETFTPEAEAIHRGTQAIDLFGSLIDQPAKRKAAGVNRPPVVKIQVGSIQTQ